MRTIVLTGGVASGKSETARILRHELGDDTDGISCDALVAHLYDSPSLIDRVVALLGDQAARVAEGGGRHLDRVWLRRELMSHPDKRKKLEAVIHPMVLCALDMHRVEAIRNGKYLFVAEVPLHYEIGEAVSADLITVVAASRSVQVGRMMEKRGIDEQSSVAFINAQLPIETKAEKADVVIWNDGASQALEAQVLLLVNQLKHA